MKFIATLLIFLSFPSWSFVCSLSSHKELGSLVMNRIKDLNCGPKKVHLTFDDGPHPEYTPKLLKELNARKVKSTFFVSTTNITPDKTVQRAIVKSEMESGHLIASHGHHHDAYDLRLNASGGVVSKAFTESEREKELKLTSLYLDQVTGGKFSQQALKLFRFPYGRGALPSDTELDAMAKKGTIHFSSNDRVTRLKEYRLHSEPLLDIAYRGYGHLLWNHDSMDSTSSAPKGTLESKANYVAQNLRNFCQSSNQDIVALFHDIKEFNPEAVALIIDLGRCLGLKFVSANEILLSKDLASRGTYLSKTKILSGVKRVDEIGNLLNGLNCDEEKTPSKGSCFSQDMNRYYDDCEGGNVSICIRGKWYGRTDQKENECRERGL